MTLLAMRWDKVVDFGSPMTAWTQEMLAQRQRPGDGQITAVEVADALTS